MTGGMVFAVEEKIVEEKISVLCTYSDYTFSVYMCDA